MRQLPVNDFLKLIDLQALGYFVKVAETGGFSNASALINVPQPTLSRHISRLEEQLGARLFDRNGRGVLLTEAGSNLFEHATSILSRMQKACAEISDIENNPAGSAVLGLAPIAGKVLSVPVAQRFMCELPDSRLRIVEAFTGHILEWVANGRIDVGILYEDSAKPSFKGEQLWQEDFVLVSARGSRLEKLDQIRFVDLKNLPLVVPGRPHGLRLKIDEVAAKVGIELNIILEIDGLNAILDLVHKGIGYAILTPPALYGFHDNQNMLLTKIVKPMTTSTVVAVSSKQRPITNAVRTLMRIIREEGRNIRVGGLTEIGVVEKARRTTAQDAVSV